MSETGRTETSGMNVVVPTPEVMGSFAEGVDPSVDQEQVRAPLGMPPSQELLDYVTTHVAGQLAETNATFLGQIAETAAEAANAKVTTALSTVVAGGQTHIQNAKDAADILTQSAQDTASSLAENVRTTTLAAAEDATSKIDQVLEATEAAKAAAAATRTATAVQKEELAKGAADSRRAAEALVTKVTTAAAGVDEKIDGAADRATEKVTAVAGEIVTEVKQVAESSVTDIRREKAVVLEATDQAREFAKKLLEAGSGVIGAAVIKALQEMRDGGKPVDVELINAAKTKLEENKNKPRHNNHPLLKAVVAADVPAYIYGQAGSGKSTGARLVAEDLGIPFEMLALGPTTTETKMVGFRDANGNVHSTGLRRAVEQGGLYLLDEIDAADPRMLVAMNASLANGRTEFPDGNIKHHPNTRFIAAANTVGKGGNQQYVGRNRLDAATLDRFAFVPWDIDPDVEWYMGTDELVTTQKPVDLEYGGVPTKKEWVTLVRRYRDAAAEVGGGHLITTRATEYGRRLIEGKMPIGLNHLISMLIHKGGHRDAIRKLDYKVGITPFRYPQA